MLKTTQDKVSIQHILDNKSVETVLQPIYNLTTNRVLGFEALSRGPKGTQLESPLNLFNAAHQHQCHAQLETICIEKAIECFARQNLVGKLFLNITPNYLATRCANSAWLQDLLHRFGLNGNRIVIEITEENPADNIEDLTNVINELRTLGFQFAIDDLGAGYSGLIQWSKIRPSLIKIDRYFVQDCDQDLMKREFLSALLNLANNTNAMTIVEGVETEAELASVRELGINFAQGFLLAKPATKADTRVPPVLQTQNDVNTNANKLSTDSVAHLLRPVKGESWQAITLDILERFKNDKSLHTIPILDEQHVVGIVMREELMEHFSKPLSHALYDKKPISLLMRTDFISVESKISLEELSRMLTDETRLEARTPFVITENGTYKGMGSVRSLLKKITDAQLERAKYSNPLTLLPGNVPIDKELDSLLARKQNFHFAYIDLNHFKPFNDQYGYAKGDQVIVLLAQLIKKICNTEHCFIGHIGGDDFVVIFYRREDLTMLNELVREFDQKVKAFFSQEHIFLGGYAGYTRSGEQTFFQLLSLSIGLVSPDVNLCTSHHHIAELAVDAKQQAKRSQGSAIFHCNRKFPTSLQANSPTRPQYDMFEKPEPALQPSNHEEANPPFLSTRAKTQLAH